MNQRRWIINSKNTARCFVERRIYGIDVVAERPPRKVSSVFGNSNYHPAGGAAVDINYAQSATRDRDTRINPESPHGEDVRASRYQSHPRAR